MEKPIWSHSETNLSHGKPVITLLCPAYAPATNLNLVRHICSKFKLRRIHYGAGRARARQWTVNEWELPSPQTVADCRRHDSLPIQVRSQIPTVYSGPICGRTLPASLDGRHLSLLETGDVAFEKYRYSKVHHENLKSKLLNFRHHNFLNLGVWEAFLLRR